MKTHHRTNRNYVNAPVDPTPAPPLRPIPSFGGTLADRMQRSTVAASVMQRISETRYRH